MSAEVLFCKAGLCCLAVLIVALVVWRTAFPKWPVLAMFAKSAMAGALLALYLVVPGTLASAQDRPREEAKEEAEELAERLKPEVEAGARQAVNADTVPGFVTATPTQTVQFSNPAGLESAGLSAMGTSQAGIFVSDSIAFRPTVTAEELATWTANGLAIQGDATTIVTEYGGAYGDCTTEITGSSTTRYTYACNEGATLLEFSDWCAIPLQVEFEPRYVYQCTINWRGDDCDFDFDSNCDAVFAHDTCSGWTHVSGGDCHGRDPYRCGAYCSNIVIETVCDTPVPGATPVLTIPGPIREIWDRAACDRKDGDPYCTFLTETCSAPNETRVINGVEITRDCWAYERTYQCAALGGVVDDCDVPAGCTLEDSLCLSTDDATGECRTWEHTYTCEETISTGGAVGYCAEDVYCIDGECETLIRPQNDEFHQAVSALEFLGQIEDDADPETLRVFPGDYAKCDKAIAGLQNCCSNDGLLVDIGFGCSANDRALAQRREVGLCRYIGAYCSSRTFFGICTKRRRTFCCFNNKLARIIHEQGRAQVGRGWGSARRPDCEGFTVALFQQLDLSVMDFSEFYGDVLDGFTPPDGDPAAAAITTRIINAYQCPPNC